MKFARVMTTLGVKPVVVSGDGAHDPILGPVTGGASGIGAAVVEELTRSGADVAVLDLRTENVRPAAAGRRRRPAGSAAEAPEPMTHDLSESQLAIAR